MANATETLERIAELLPKDQRERFFATIATFKQVPEDDEYLMTLEAIGFMTLVWKEIPDKIQEIMAGAVPANLPSTEYFANEIRKTIKESLDFPSHEDFRQLIHELEDQQTKFVHAVRSTQKSRPAVTKSQVPAFLAGLCTGAVSIVLTIVFLPDLPTDLQSLYSGAARDRALCRKV